MGLPQIKTIIFLKVLLYKIYHLLYLSCNNLNSYSGEDEKVDIDYMGSVRLKLMWWISLYKGVRVHLHLPSKQRLPMFQ